VRDALAEERFKLELQAAHFELVTEPLPDVEAAGAALAAARRTLREKTDGLVRPLAAGMHPFGGPEGHLNRGERYDRIGEEFGWVVRRQLVCALQVHVAVGGADRTLAVYNGLRSLLPELAALAANAPYFGGEDTGFASIRPVIAGTLPRQGVPPHIPSWEAFAEELRWGAASGAVPEPRLWWWELRPHADFGTLEVRMPDAQTTVEDATAVAGVVHSLIAWLSERHDEGERFPEVPTWRIEENRWSACRYGVEGSLADLETGGRSPTRERLHALLEAIEPVGRKLGAGRALTRARALVERNGALEQRAVGAERGAHGLAEWLAERFVASEA